MAELVASAARRTTLGCNHPPSQARAPARPIARSDPTLRAPASTLERSRSERARPRSVRVPRLPVSSSVKGRAPWLIPGGS